MLRRTALKSMIAGPGALALGGAEGRKPNIILISLDQLDAGRLHTYGNPRKTSPNLDRLAAEGTRLSNFYAASPWTTPSYGSIMTSQYPSRHGATLFHPPGIPGLKPDATPLAEIFQGAGYKTAAFVNNGVAGPFLTGRGFAEYDQGQRRPLTITERSDYTASQKPPSNADERSAYLSQSFRAPATNQRILRWLDANGNANAKDPFFLFLLYFEPHSPYDPPPEHDLFKNDAYPEATNTGYDVTKGSLFRKANLRDPKAIERLYQLYDGKIHFIDYYIGELVDRLRAKGLDQNTILLLTSDHGELVYQHVDDYMTFDHRSLYNNVLHVPFYLWGKGIPQGKVVHSLGSHVDIAPTLLELAGLAPKRDAQGFSLAPVIQGKKESVRKFVVSEQDVLEPLRAVNDGRYKLIWNTRTGAQLLFDRHSDPAERHNIAARNPAVVERLTGLLTTWRKENEIEPEWRAGRWREIAEKGAPVQIVDEVTTGAHLQLTGPGWKPVDGNGNFGGGAYWTEAAKPGETERTATWRSDNPLIGDYRVSIWYGGLPEGRVAADAPFTVVSKSGAKKFPIDQTANAGKWQELGVFEDPLHVILTNRAGGRILVDAVKFERLG
jgi:arylsulfatase A-like enzyme